MHKGRENHQHENRERPREAAELFGYVGDPVKAYQGQNKLSPPSGSEALFPIFSVAKNENPEGSVTKKERPRRERNVAGAYQHAGDEWP